MKRDQIDSKRENGNLEEMYALTNKEDGGRTKEAGVCLKKRGGEG